MNGSKKRTREEYSASKKLSALTENKLLTIEAIFSSVIDQPSNNSFLRSVHGSVDFGFGSFRIGLLNVNLGAEKRFWETNVERIPIY